MGSSEPSLVPQWLKSNGNTSQSGKTGYQSVSSISRTDAASVGKYSRNKSFRSIGESDSPRTHSVHPSANNTRRSSANNIISSKHSCNSFSRSNRGYNQGRENLRSDFVEIWDDDCLDPRGTEALRRSHSLISRKQEFFLPRTVASESNNIDRSNLTINNSLHYDDLTRKSTKTAEVVAEVSNPVDEKHGVPDMLKVASPCLTVSAQGLPIGSSALVGEGWSALADVPAVVGTNNVGSSGSIPGHQPLEVSSTSGVSVPGFGISNFEARAQSPETTYTASQAFVDPQKLEQIAMRQYKQLIPMVPATPKLMASSSAYKLKPKIALRNGYLSNPSKTGIHSQTSGYKLEAAPLANRAFRDTKLICEPLKATQVGKFYVLRPPWETVHKDVSAFTNDVGNKGLDSLASPSSSAASLSKSNCSRAPPVERKAAASNQNAHSVDKKRMFSHARSRNEFFNSMRKKTSMNNSLCTEASSVTSVHVEHSNEVVKDTTASTLSSKGFENHQSNCIGGAYEVDQRSPTKEDYSGSVTDIIPGEEEEAEFLRSLGWEEFGSEDDCLTEDEINSFYQEVMKLWPTLKLCEAMQQQPKASLLHKLMLGWRFIQIDMAN